MDRPDIVARFEQVGREREADGRGHLLRERCFMGMMPPDDSGPRSFGQPNRGENVLPAKFGRGRRNETLGAGRGL